MSEQQSRRSPGEPRKHSAYFFAREVDGSIRLRMRFDGAEASLFEEAAGDTPVMTWLHRTLGEAARQQVAEARSKRPRIAAPPE